jgi:hypothetical protein
MDLLPYVINTRIFNISENRLNFILVDLAVGPIALAPIFGGKVASVVAHLRSSACFSSLNIGPHFLCNFGPIWAADNHTKSNIQYDASN